jgi:hypothetical protein
MQIEEFASEQSVYQTEQNNFTITGKQDYQKIQISKII